MSSYFTYELKKLNMLKNIILHLKTKINNKFLMQLFALNPLLFGGDENIFASIKVSHREAPKKIFS